MMEAWGYFIMGGIRDADEHGFTRMDTEILFLNTKGNNPKRCFAKGLKGLLSGATGAVSF
jgi:hypothetical protein